MSGFNIGHVALSCRLGAPAEQTARMITEYGRVEALKVISTGCERLGRVYVAVTGPFVPNVYGGMVTFAFEALITVKLCSPAVLSATLTVTDPGPDVIASNAKPAPGNDSVTVSVGVHVPSGVGVGTGVGEGVGVAVGKGVGVGVAVGEGVGVGVAVGVGVGPPPEHCARIRMAYRRKEARSVKSTG